MQPVLYCINEKPTEQPAKTIGLQQQDQSNIRPLGRQPDLVAQASPHDSFQQRWKR